LASINSGGKEGRGGGEREEEERKKNETKNTNLNPLLRTTSFLSFLEVDFLTPINRSSPSFLQERTGILFLPHSLAASYGLLLHLSQVNTDEGQTRVFWLLVFEEISKSFTDIHRFVR
jgi:hypothetical protein